MTMVRNARSVSQTVSYNDIVPCNATANAVGKTDHSTSIGGKPQRSAVTVTVKSFLESVACTSMDSRAWPRY
jgi:hypothetical protein